METIAPGVHVLEVTDGALFDEGLDVVEIRVEMTLGATLRGELVLIFEVSFTNRARLLDGIGEGFLAEDVIATVHRPDGHERVMMVRGAANDGVDILLIQCLAPVGVFFGFGELRSRGIQGPRIDVTQRDHVLLLQHGEVGGGPSPTADERYIQLIAWAVGPEEGAGGENHHAGAERGGLGEEFAARTGEGSHDNEEARGCGSKPTEFLVQ